ncbi:MAG: hypothetical protein HUU32_09275 [Calditrichaceae bacterium]|nr:prephenate dehydratase [Calditrichia bacterium]NUQ41570.1 hypothetical protein [Calditrichaceae bacterium]
MKVAIQGGQASFHHLAARQYFNGQEFEMAECRTFRQLCQVLQNGKADRAVMAIENSLLGSILPNYALLQEYSFHISGETYLHIRHNLMALPGQSLKDIRFVCSHPLALLQCSEFLEQHPRLRAQESFDTAESAREIREKLLPGTAAIAGRLAAERYQLTILAEEIENVKQNYTRFLILSRKAVRENGAIADKTSLNFYLKHRVGALAEALDIFRRCGLNLTLIQSLPVPGRPSEYAFQVDLEGERRKSLEQGIEELRRLSDKIQVLGIYPKGALPHDYSGGKAA